MRGRARAAALTLLLPLVAAPLIGCGRPSASAFAVSRAPAARPDRTVPAHVVHTPADTLVLVPVRLAGKGPYPFILDTGAARSVVDQQLAGRLRLVATGTNAPATGVACTVTAGQVRVSNWSLGRVPLAGQELAALAMAGAPGGSGIAGLLGSDVWSRFGGFRLDYRAGRLTVPAQEVPGSGGPAEPIGTRAAKPAPTRAPTAPAHRLPLTVIRHGGSVLVLVSVGIAGRPPVPFGLDTGSASSVIAADLAARLALPAAGPARKVAGVSCAASAQPVHVAAWRLGGVDLPAQNLLRIALPIAGMHGLVGSDVRYRFGSITLEFAAGHLLLG